MTTTIRSAAPADAALILQFIRELATFEKAPEAVRATVEDLLRDGFGSQPRFESFIAEVDGSSAGFALFFYNYFSMILKHLSNEAENYASRLIYLK